MTELRELAERLAQELVCCGHDTSTLDVLDALATTGLTLTTDDSGAVMSEASAAYMDMLRGAVG